MLPSAADVIAAAHRLRGVVRRTPLVASSAEGLRAPLHLKCEHLQRTGSFKLRGAYNALATLPEASRAAGVVASSAGNHGLGLADAARRLGIRARIFVPATAPAVKRDGIIALGADVDASQPNYDAAHEAALAFADAHGLAFVNPCAGASLLAGQGTVALEILEDLPGVKTVVAPVGGGGLVGGMGALLRAVAPGVRIVGAQSERTNAMAASLAAGRRVDVEVLATLADGLAGQVEEEGFAIGRLVIDEMRVVTEAQVADAIARAARALGARVEGSGAVALAAVLDGEAAALQGPVAVVLSGGNIDEAVWKGIIARA